MSFYENCKNELIAKGLSEKEAEEVLKIEISNNADMKSRWYAKVSDYPPVISSYINKIVARTALAYIEEHCPEAWFKPMFDENSPAWKE